MVRRQVQAWELKGCALAAEKSRSEFSQNSTACFEQETEESREQV